MNVRVDENRFLSVACEPEERVVFDRQETKYHLLRESAAKLWDEIGDGGSFEVTPTPGEAADPVAELVGAGLVSIEDAAVPKGISRRVWLSKTGKASAAAIVLPLVATIATPKFAIGQVAGSAEATNNEIQNFQQGETNSLFRTQSRRERRRDRKNQTEVTSTPTIETTETLTQGTRRRRRRNR